MKQLIVLGNGFDLNSGLHSTYSDFCIDRYKETGNHSYATDIALDEDQYCIWDLVLRHEMSKHHDKGEINWCDIEQMMYDWLTGNEICSFVNFPEYFITQQAIFTFFGKTSTRAIETDFEYLFLSMLVHRIKHYYKELADAIIPEDCPEVSQYTSRGSSKLIYDLITEVLHRELQVLEKGFNNYLHKQQTEEYRLRAKSLYLDLSLEGVAECDEIDDSVLCFNYTNPLRITQGAEYQKEIANKEIKINLQLWHNIHGRLYDPDSNPQNEEIILGIGGYGHELQPRVREFTKAERKLHSHTQLRDREHYNNLFHEKIDFVKVFGHSLADSDYAYFHSIFDRIDIYNGNTVLFFLGTDQHPISTDKVNALITKYENNKKKFNNYDNLFEKLVSDERLIILNSIHDFRQ